MKRYLKAGLPAAALLLGLAGCGDTNNYYTTATPETPVTPVLDCSKAIYSVQPTVKVGTGTGKAIITVDGKQFRDLDADAKLSPFEDWRLPETCRAIDLLGRMTVPQKVGLMSESTYVGGGTADGTIPAEVQAVIVNDHVRQSLIRLGSASAAQLAVYLNNLQVLAETQPLAIPVVITTDPSHGFSMNMSNLGAMSDAASTIVTPWPQPLGLGAINDAAVTKAYGDVVRREFMAMGFRWQLGPQIDLATEPRWARVQSLFGDSGPEVSKHAAACIEGFQGSATGDVRNGIVATMKHFPGGGPNEQGKDSHTSLGRFNVYPGNNFLYHQLPFRAAIGVGAAAVMPNYSILKDQYGYDPLQVGAAFSKELITDYLKDTLGFTGMVTSDWGTMSFAANGVEALTPPERAALFVQAGSDQLGSDSYTIVQAAFDQGLLSEDELDRAAGKILEMSFKLGIFENPYVDAAAAGTIVRSEANMREGFDAQKKAVVILKNVEHSSPSFCPVPFFCINGGARYLPIVGDATHDTTGDGTVRVYFDGVVDSIAGDPLRPDQMSRFLGDYDYTSPAAGAALAVDATTTPDTADIAVLRIVSRKGSYFGLDEGVPLSFDAPFPGKQADVNEASAVNDAHKVINLLRKRDGYRLSDGTAVAPTNPNLKIVLVMHMDRPAIVAPFVNGLATLDETPGVPGSYPLVSNPANEARSGLAGVDAFLVEFGAWDRAVLDVLFNVSAPAGFAYGSAKLPIEIPSSDAEVSAQLEDLPSDTPHPTYFIGAGQTY